MTDVQDEYERQESNGHDQYNSFKKRKHKTQEHER